MLKRSEIRLVALGAILIAVAALSFVLRHISFAPHRGHTPASGPEVRERDASFGGDHFCFYAGSDGRVWVQDTTQIGMWGDREFFTHMLSPAESQRLASLVNRPGDWLEGRGIFCFRGYLGGKVPLEQALRILVRFDGRCRPAKTVRTRYGDAQVSEITSVRLLHVEFLSAEWLEAWRQLDQALAEVVAVSRMAPTEEKRERLTQAIERGSLALNTMANPKVAEDARALVHRIEPRARVVTEFQRHGADSWRREFEECISRLRIEPKTPIPPRPAKPQRCLEAYEWLGMLASSASPEDLLSRLRQSCSEDALDEQYFPSPGFKRNLYASDLQGMAPETFGRLREEAQGVVERRRADLDRYRADKGPDTVISWEFGGMTYDEFQYFQEWAQQIGESQRTSLPVEKAGVVVRRVDSDLMARKMILGGLVIEEVLAEIPGLGYRAGDVVLCYNRGYDAPWNTEWNWDAMERALHSLTIPRDNRWAPPILRGDRILARETGGGVSGGTE